jgi:hypothetical protein
MVGSQVLPCPEQGGADGQVLWLSRQCQPGKEEKQNQDEWIPCIPESDESSKGDRKNRDGLIHKIYEVNPFPPLNVLLLLIRFSDKSKDYYFMRPLYP